MMTRPALSARNPDPGGKARRKFCGDAPPLPPDEIQPGHQARYEALPGGADEALHPAWRSNEWPLKSRRKPVSSAAGMVIHYGHQDAGATDPSGEASPCKSESRSQGRRFAGERCGKPSLSPIPRERPGCQGLEGELWWAKAGMADVGTAQLKRGDHRAWINDSSRRNQENPKPPTRPHPFEEYLFHGSAAGQRGYRGCRQKTGLAAV